MLALPSAELLCGHTFLLHSPSAETFLLFFPLCLQCLHCYMLSSVALKNLNQCCLITLVLLCAFHASSRVLAFSILTSYSHCLFIQPMVNVTTTHLFAYHRECMCKPPSLPSFQHFSIICFVFTCIVMLFHAEDLPYHYLRNIEW